MVLLSNSDENKNVNSLKKTVPFSSFKKKKQKQKKTTYFACLINIFDSILNLLALQENPRKVQLQMTQLSST